MGHPRERKRQLDGLRFFAFLLVFFCHAGHFRLSPRFEYGSNGTEVFFALSGFLITRMLLLNSGGSLLQELKTFYIRRTLRIFPVYYAYLTILVLLGKITEPLAYFLYVINIKLALGYQCAFSHLWTLSVEEQYYLVYPLLLLIAPSRWRLYLLLGLVCLFEYCHWILVFRPGFWTACTLTRTALMWGSLAGFLDVKYSQRKINGGALFAIGIAFALISACMDACIQLYKSSYPFYFIGEPFRVVGFSLIVWGLWRAKSEMLLAPFTFEPIAYLGQISYGLYLFHGGSFFLRSWLVKIVPTLNTIEPISFVLLLTIAQATLSWHFFEKPINDLKERFRFDQYKKAADP